MAADTMAFILGRRVLFGYARGYSGLFLSVMQHTRSIQMNLADFEGLCIVGASKYDAR